MMLDRSLLIRHKLYKYPTVVGYKPSDSFSYPTVVGYIPSGSSSYPTVVGYNCSV